MSSVVRGVPCLRRLAVLLLAGTGVLGPAAAYAADDIPPLLPLSAFAAMPALIDPKVSPDGQSMAASFRREGEQLLVVHSLFGKTPPRTVPLGRATLNWLKWVNDQYLVASLRQMKPWEGEDYPLDRILLIDRDLKEPALLGPKTGSFNGDEVIFWAPDRSYLLLSVARTIYDWPEVLRVELPGNKITRVQREREGISDWWANDRGQVVAGFGRLAGGKSRLIYRPTPDAPFTNLKFQGVAGSDGEGETVHIIDIDAERQKGVVLSRRGTDRWGLHEYDFASQRYGAELFAHERFDVDDFEFDDARRLRWASYMDDRRRVRWFKDADAALAADLEKAVPDKLIQIVSESSDGGTRIVMTSSPTDPGTFYAYTEASGRMGLLASMNEKLKGQRLAPTAYVSYQARDGLAIPAYLTLPLDRRPEQLPLIVMPHGGPYTRDSWGYDYLVQYLTNRGYAVLQPNFRGSTGYGKDFEEKGYQQWGQAMQDDVDDGVKWLVASGQVDPRRVCVVGWSYGGYAAQVAAFRNPDLYRCAVSVAGVSDLPALLRYDVRWMYGSMYSEWRAQVAGDQSAAAMKAVSPLAQAAAVRVPLLLVHGAEDDRVPVKQSDKMAKALREAGKPVEYVRIKDGDHSLADSGQRLQLFTALERFLATHNPTDVLTPTTAAAN